MSRFGKSLLIYFLLASSAFSVSGCQIYRLQELRNISPSGSEFQQALAREYLRFAEEEEMNYNWKNSWHFADKGMTAAYGNDVGPENIEDWNIAEPEKTELATARDDLLTALKPQILAANPDLAARAYRYFDCWIARQQDGWQQQRIAACKEAFSNTLAELQEAASAAENANKGGQNKTTNLSESAEINTTSYIVFFEWNRATLNKTGEKQLHEVAKELAEESDFEVILHGHTDTTGLERFNLTLSKKRAETVAHYLVKKGIAENKIKIFAFGESDPRLPTADNVDEPQNRRVEIFIE